MASVKETIKYLRSCYRADNRSTGLFTFSGNKVDYKLILEDPGLLTGETRYFQVPKQWAYDVRYTLEIHGGEKACYLAAIFVISTRKVASKKLNVRTPLLLIPISFEDSEETDESFVKANFEQLIFNESAIRLLCDENDSGDLFGELQKWKNDEPLTFGSVGQLKRILGKYQPEKALEELLLYPTLTRTSRLSRATVKEGVKVLPGAGLCVIDKSGSAIGTLNELEHLEKASEFSRPIQVLYGQKDIETKDYPHKIQVPAILSEAQEKAIQAADKYFASLVVGPPGTGKSFTLAAIALDFMIRKRSVLIVAANDQAVDVLLRKIEDDFGIKGIALRAGDSWEYRSKMTSRLQSWLSGNGLEQVWPFMIQKEEKRIKKLEEEIEELEQILHQRENKEIKRGQFLAQDKRSPLAQLRKRSIRWKKGYEQTYWYLFTRLKNKRQDLTRSLRQLVILKFDEQLYKTFMAHRHEIRDFVSAIRARTRGRKHDLFSNLNVNLIKKTFPIILVSAEEVNKVIPLEKELFDLVIIDEATQCDMTSVLPVLQRSRRVVIAGDPKQLRHISFLSRQRQKFLGEEHGLSIQEIERYNFREKSFLDLVSESLNSQDQVSFLNEHFRSLPSIINFSNEQFYHGNLRIMTANPVNNASNNVQLIRLEGQRDDKGKNDEEARFIIENIRSIIDEEAELESNLCQSIGILSPFRQQVDHLLDYITQEFELTEIKRHRLRAGTAHSFQGEERDVMFISMVLDDEAHPSSFRHLTRHDVFNVSITRARIQQWVVTSTQKGKSSFNSALLFRQYLEYLERLNQHQSPAETSNYDGYDDFLEEVITWLKKIKAGKVHAAYQIAGIEIDLVVTRDGKSYCIDLIGFPGQFETAFPIERYKILDRIGVRAFPLPFSRWHLEPARTKGALMVYLNLRK